MDQLSFFELPVGLVKEPVSPGLKRYAVVRKTYPPRRTPRQPYLFLILLDSWKAKADRLARQAENGGPRYELVTTIDHTIKRIAAMRAREMYPGETVLEREEI